MERPSQILAMRAPAGDWTGLARRLEQRLGERAAANTHDLEMYHAARAHRSFALGEIIIAAIHAVGTIAHQRRRQAGAIYDAFRQLDDRTLHDLGFDRSEIRSLAAEVTGEAECTRVRALQTSCGLSK